MKLCLVAVTALAAALALPSAAHAQAPPPNTATNSDYSEKNIDGNQVVDFRDDVLPVDLESQYGFTLRRPPGIIRALLLRPRMNFVPELLKTIENL